jgi:hypothetical protein
MKNNLETKFQRNDAPPKFQERRIAGIYGDRGMKISGPIPMDRGKLPDMPSRGS